MDQERRFKFDLKNICIYGSGEVLQTRLWYTRKSKRLLKFANLCANHFAEFPPLQTNAPIPDHRHHQNNSLRYGTWELVVNDMHTVPLCSPWLWRLCTEMEVIEVIRAAPANFIFLVLAYYSIITSSWPWVIKDYTETIQFGILIFYLVDFDIISIRIEVPWADPANFILLVLAYYSIIASSWPWVIHNQGFYQKYTIWHINFI